MATLEQKEELIETLKFTPRKYKVELTGYGGELYFGKVDRKIYDFFKAHKIDIEEYASDWDDEKWEFVPSELRPFEPGSAWDISGVHESGATFDELSYITVYDENGNEVWTSPLGISALEESGVTVENSDEEHISEYNEGTVVFYGAQGEKGFFFSNEFEITEPFDPKKLMISYGDYNGWEMVSGVQYNGEDIDSNDYDTSGKWGETKWIIVGDEEVYEGISRDEIEDDNEDSIEELDDFLSDLGASLGMPMTPEEEEEAYTSDCRHCDWSGPIVSIVFKDGKSYCPNCGEQFVPPTDDEDSVAGNNEKDKE